MGKYDLIIRRISAGADICISDEQIENAISLLTHFQQTIMIEYYVQHYTIRSVSASHQVSRHVISREIAKAIKLLRDELYPEHTQRLLALARNIVIS